MTLRLETSFFNSRGERLAATLHRPEGGGRRGVIVCHGMLSERRSAKHVGICEALARRGLLALRFDFSGRGESEGRGELLSYEREVEDLEAAIAFLEGEVDRLVLVGSSMGGAVAILTARSQRRVEGVVGVATVGRPLEVLRGLVPEEVWPTWEREGVVSDGVRTLGVSLLESSRRVDVLAAVDELSCPLLLIHGGQDRIVPLAQAEELERHAKRGRLHIVQDGDHLLHRAQDQAVLEEEIGRFVEELLGERRG